MTRAAEAIHVSQSTVTHHLKSLQAVLGIRLLEPAGRSIRPTAVGRDFGPSARAAITSLLDVVEVARSLSNVESGTLRIAASQTTVSHYLPMALTQFLSDRPGVTIEVVPGNTAQVCEEVQTAQVDIGLIEASPTVPNLVQRRLVRDEVIIVIARRHPIAVNEPFLRQHLLMARYVAREAGSGTELLAAAMLGELYHRVSRVELGQLDAVRAAVRSGLGFAALPRLAVQAEVDAGLIVPLPIPARSRWIRAVRRPTISAPVTEAFWRLLGDLDWGRSAPSAS